MNPSTDLGPPAVSDVAETQPQVAASSLRPIAEGEPLSLPYRIVTLLVVIVPFVALILAIALLWGRGFNWLELSMFVGMYIATGLGITIGYHRFFTHRSFMTGKVMQSILGVLGSMALEGPILRWVATHRCHHQHSDDEHDPHSPHTHGAGFVNMTKGLWRAHVGWLFEPYRSDLKRYVADFNNDRLVKAISALFPVWAILGIIIPGVITGLITMTWTGAFLGVLWGGLVRIFFVHHVTWSINSVCHIWGTRPFRSHDESRNNPIFGVLAFGEGWHNNHHAFPTSARHGLAWWQLDTSYLVILAMSKIGLVWDVRTPSRERVEAKKKGLDSTPPKVS